MVAVFNGTKEFGLPMDESLRPMRIRINPIRLGEGLVCNDQMESRGVIQILEHTGDTLYVMKKQLKLWNGRNCIRLI